MRRPPAAPRQARLCVAVACLLCAAAVAADEPDEDEDYFSEPLSADAAGASVAADAGAPADRSGAAPGSGGGKGPRHKELAEEFALRRAELAENTGGEGLSFSRMATPLRRRSSRREEEEAGAGEGVSESDATRFYVPGKTEAKVSKTLGTCLHRVRKRKTAQYYDSMDCFEDAITQFPLNSTWHKRLGTLHLLTGAVGRAVQLYNESVRLLFDMAKYRTSDEALLANGGLQFIRLFNHRDHSSAVEVAKLSAFNYSFRMQLSDAKHLYEGFLLTDEGEAYDDAQLLWTYVETLAAQGQWESIPAVLNRLAALEDHLEGLPPVLLTLRLLSDSADLTARRLLSLPLRNASKETRKAAEAFIKDYCGREDPFAAATLSRSTLIAFALDCLLAQIRRGESKGEGLGGLLRKDAAVLKKDRGGFLQGTPLHFAASLGGTNYGLIDILVRSGVEVDATTRFGHTALHIALAGGHYGAARHLLREHASLAAKDARQLTALEAACRHASWVDRKALARAIGEDPAEDPCDKEDGDALVLHMKQKPRNDYGGWTAGEPAPAVAETLAQVQERPTPVPGDEGDCQIDIRRGDMLGVDLLMDYLLIGRPVLLRGSFPNKLSKKFRKLEFLAELGSMRGRAEPFPNAEYYGASGAQTVRLSDFISATSEELPRTFTEKLPGFDRRKVARDVAPVVPRNHPLQDFTAWEPPFLSFDGFTYNATHEPQLQVGGPGAGTGAAVLTTAAVHIMPFGSRRWFLSPPPHAFASRRHPLEVFRARRGEWRAIREPFQGRSVLECNQRPGDVLIVPRDWSSISINTREVVAYSQSLDLDALWPVYGKGNKKGKKPKKSKADPE
eukprot:TRINITY_DN1360_c1_g1_i1.p1 TRINITY_DN1360_c1_g1~~TRINITY_DN1360_c1_g1_i1.p1  ORF type:complete len:845 (+),score=255.06 TRINITY_DN1360_c1_g1_i1:89-2623(+)